MASYPYSTSGQGAVVQAISQLRKGFPTKLDAGYLKRFKIAPANESFIISIVRFLGLIDEEGGRSEEATSYFFGDDDAFKAGLEGTLRSSYSQLFDEMGDAAWTAEKAQLIHWFRAADRTSELVGKHQASTFQTLAALAGYGEVPAARGNAAASKQGTKAAPAKKAAPQKVQAKPAAQPRAGAAEAQDANSSSVGLSVRIEVNLPHGETAETYDAIFASIKKHLMS